MNANGTDAKSTKAATDIKSAAQNAEVHEASG